MLLEQPPGAQHAQRKLGERAKRPQHPDPIQPADLDELERKSGRRHQLGLKAIARTDEDRLMPVGLQLARHGEQRHHVSARPSAGHHDCRHPFPYSMPISSVPGVFADAQQHSQADQRAHQANCRPR